MIKITGLNLKFAAFELRDINLRIKPGEYFILLGPTGAGKTLLLEAIAGLHKLESGHIYIKGQEATDLSPELRRAGIVYQDYALFPHLTVAQNITYGLKQKGLPKQQQKEIAREMADFLGISRLLSRYPPTLSGGEQQRTALARALVVEPEILLLDEPLSALDNQSKKKMQQELRRIHREFKKTILHITHDMEEALSLGDKIGIMEQGRIIQVGSPQEVFQKPVNQFVAEFVGHDNIFRGRIEEKNRGKMVLAEGVEFYVAGENLLAGEEGFLLLPAEGIILSPIKIQSSARNCFSGTVSTVEKRGFISIVTLDIGIPIVAKVTTSSVEEMGITVGSKLFATFKATSLHFFS